MSRGGANRASVDVKGWFFEFIRQGLTGSAASMAVRVSPSCASLWFVDAGSVQVTETVAITPLISEPGRPDRDRRGLRVRRGGEGDRGPDREELPERLPGDPKEPERRWPLPAVVRSQPGAPPTETAPSTRVRDGPEGAGGRRQAAQKEVVA